MDVDFVCANDDKEQNVTEMQLEMILQYRQQVPLTMPAWSSVSGEYIISHITEKGHAVKI